MYALMMEQHVDHSRASIGSDGGGAWVVYLFVLVKLTNLQPNKILPLRHRHPSSSILLHPTPVSVKRTLLPPPSSTRLLLLYR